METVIISAIAFIIGIVVGICVCAWGESSTDMHSHKVKYKR